MLGLVHGSRVTRSQGLHAHDSARRHNAGGLRPRNQAVNLSLVLSRASRQLCHSQCRLAPPASRVESAARHAPMRKTRLKSRGEAVSNLRVVPMAIVYLVTGVAYLRLELLAVHRAGLLADFTRSAFIILGWKVLCSRSHNHSLFFHPLFGWRTFAFSMAPKGCFFIVGLLLLVYLNVPISWCRFGVIQPWILRGKCLRHPHDYFQQLLDGPRHRHGFRRIWLHDVFGYAGRWGSFSLPAKHAHELSPFLARTTPTARLRRICGNL